MGDFDGKVALVTGGASGLGRETCKLFAHQGAKVVVADINRVKGQETVDMIKAAGGEATFAYTDVSKSADIQNMVKTAVDTYGGLHCAVNNVHFDVGMWPTADIPEEAWEKSLSINLTGQFLGLKYEIRQMLKQGGGTIVCVGSGNSGNVGTQCRADYIAAKAAVYGMVRTAALDYGNKGIRINAVGPGVMWTPWNADIPEEAKEWMRTLSPMDRGANPEEVAEAILWLCSDKSSFVLGHLLIADGGATIGTPRYPGM